MKSKTIVAVILTIALIASMLMVATVSAACNLPSDPVTVTVGPPVPPLAITLSDVPAGYDVTNGVYTGYCTELGIPLVSPITATLECTDNLGSPWNEINYLLNTYPDSLDLQLAIWRLLGYTPAFMAQNQFTYTAAAETLYQDALANGGGFDPSAGDWVGVRLIINGQDFLIKIQIPEGAPGFTPGFWKHNIGVALGINPGHYSAFGGGPLDGVKLTSSMLEGYAATVGVTLQEAYDALNTKGQPASTRINMANAFNAAAGYGPFVED
jgi:hypothetical protein